MMGDPDPQTLVKFKHEFSKQYLVVASCFSSLTVSSPSPQGTTIFTVLKLTVTFILSLFLTSAFSHHLLILTSFNTLY
jgi:hypothetical protein